MVTRGFWNVYQKGSWYQIRQKRERITSPGDQSTYLTLKRLQDGIASAVNAISIPFPLPLRQNLSYVYTLDLEEGSLTVSFWDREAEDEGPGLKLTMRCLSLTSIHQPADLSIPALLRNGNNPFHDKNLHRVSLHTETGYKDWHVNIGQPSSLNEVQDRMLTDFVYQWQFFLDEYTVWGQHSRTLVQRLCIAVLRLAAWDLEISFQADIAKLPLDAESYPSWESPREDIYWFHGFLIVLYEDFGKDSISMAISRAREFVFSSSRRGEMQVTCVLMTLGDICFARISSETTQCSTVFPLFTNMSATECAAGFRILTHLFTSPRGKEEKDNFECRETSSIDLPQEVLDMILNAVTPYDIVSFAQASLKVKNWYYSSLPQLANMTIHHLDASIPCCGRTNMEGSYCVSCYTWRHFECLDSNSKHPLEAGMICPKCHVSSQSASSQPRLVPGALGRLNRRVERTDGCRVTVCGQEKVLQLRVTSPAVMRPELRLRDPDLTSTPPNQIDYVVLFGGKWSGLAYGLDDVAATREGNIVNAVV